MNDQFTETLFQKMQAIHPGIAELELYEFRYGLDNLTPEGSWENVPLEPCESIEKRVNDRTFYEGLQIKPKIGDQIVLDEQIKRLTQTLLAGLACGAYPPEWINRHFYFDLRGFNFLHRTEYFTPAVLAHFGGRPLCQFPLHQRQFEPWSDLGYKAFKAANLELDTLFIYCIEAFLATHKASAILAIAGPTAAGKTEIVARLRARLERAGQQIASIELDNFLTDRDQREARGIFTRGKEALHFNLLLEALADLSAGKKVNIPRYDFISATSSHHLDGSLKPGGKPVEIEPAEVIFIEGNFPFLIPEVARRVSLKVVYLTDDPVRLKRKWKRDIDLRKKYEPTYFRNRYFKEQFIMAEIAYRPQLEACDLCVDTTGGALWATPDMAHTFSLIPTESQDQ